MIARKPAICGVCPGGCAVEVTLEDGRLVEVEPRQDAPYGNLCIRGKHAPEIVYAPERLRHPLIRTGERGEGRFREASWDEALDLAVRKMQEIRDRYGPQALISHSGRGAFEQSMLDFCNSPQDTVASKLLLPFGSPNIASTGSLCYTSFGILAPALTFGLPGNRLTPDLEQSKLIIVWGSNPVTDSPPWFFKRIVRAQKNGARVIAIDHMQCDIARRADQWVAVRSGTDGALALGLISAIIREEIYDRVFVERWMVGFDDLRAYVQQFTPERVEQITGVPAATVTSLAREIAVTERVSLRTYTGLEYTNSGVQNIRAAYLLWALAGHLDVPGGLLITPVPRPPLQRVEMPVPDGVLPIGAREYPLFYELTGSAQYLELPKAVLHDDPYPVRGLLINGSSTLTSYPQPEIFEDVYHRLDFMLVIDIITTRDALFADVVLPSATYYEINSYQRYPDYVRLRQQVIPPVGEARNQTMILAELARRLGYGHLYPQSEEELIAAAFARAPELLQKLQESPDGVSASPPERRYRKWETGDLRPDGQPGFPTPSGKVEVTSSLLAQYGYDSLPVYSEPLEGPLASPEAYEEFPLVLNTGARIQSTFRSQHLNVPGLLRLQVQPQALINPRDARVRSIEQGDRVVVSTKRGRVVFWARVTSEVLPGCVEVNMGGGNPCQVEAWRQSNANSLTDWRNRDPISGFPVFKALLCQVTSAENTG
jgi:anaerobic selenocysteine-containing dehydrogenase